MRAFCFSVAVFLLPFPGYVHAEKLTLAHVAVNPSQGIFWVAKDSGILTKYRRTEISEHCGFFKYHIFG